MKNFFDCKDGKITEKAFSQSMIVSIASILLCIVMLCSLTYAWFNTGISSEKNKLEAGHFGIDIVSVILEETDIEVLPDDAGIYTLEAEKTYKITLNPTVESTVKGYCLVLVNGAEYRTDVIVNENTVSEAYPIPNAPFEFYIHTGEESNVQIVARWGVPADVGVAHSGVIDLSLVPSPDSGDVIES